MSLTTRVVRAICGFVICAMAIVFATIAFSEDSIARGVLMIVIAVTSFVTGVSSVVLAVRSVLQSKSDSNSSDLE